MSILLFILGEDEEEALAEASTHDLVDLAAILGFHSMMNQDQYHENESGKWAQKAEQIGILKKNFKLYFKLYFILISKFNVQNFLQASTELPKLHP